MVHEHHMLFMPCYNIGQPEIPTTDLCQHLQKHVPDKLWNKLTVLAEKITEDLQLHLHVSSSCPLRKDQDLIHSVPDRRYRKKIREIAVFNLRSFKAFFCSEPDVLVSAVHMLDCFLSKVKVQPKYMSCVTAACFRLASDAHSSGRSPSAEEFCRLNKHAWSACDLVRMERKVEEKVGAVAGRVTSITFLHTFYQLMALVDPLIISLCPWGNLTTSIEACLASHLINLFRPCTLALSLLDVVLQDLCESIRASEVVTIVFILQSYCQISDAELYECNEAVISMLQRYREGQRVRDRGSVKKRGRSLLSRPCLPAIPEEVSSPV